MYCYDVGMLQVPYICMVVPYGKGKHQPDKVVNPARVQLNMIFFFLVPVCD